MKKLGFAVMLFAAGTFVMAQEAPVAKKMQHKTTKERSAIAEQKRKQHMAQMQTELGLSAKQVQQIQELQDKLKSERMVHLEKNRELMKQNREKMKTLHETRNAEMKKILNAEQYAKWQEARAAKMAKHKAEFRNKKDGMMSKKRVHRTVEPVNKQ